MLARFFSGPGTRFPIFKFILVDPGCASGLVAPITVSFFFLTHGDLFTRDHEVGSFFFLQPLSLPIFSPLLPFVKDLP